MKILFVSTLYAPDIGGGAEITLQNLVEEMQRSGCDVSVLALGSGRRIERQVVNGIPVWRAPIRNLFLPYKSRAGRLRRYLWQLIDRYNWLAKRDVAAVIRELAPDVVSCHNLAGWSISAWDAIKQAKLPIVQTLHDQYLLCPRSSMFKSERRCLTQCASCSMMRRRHSASSRRVDALVGVSSFILEKFESFGYFEGVGNVQAIANTRKAPGRGNNCSGRSGKFVVGYIGAIIGAKGIGILMNAFVRAAQANWELLIAGDDETALARGLKAQVRDERIEWLGRVDANQFYQMVDVVVVPSIWDEPLGMVAAEALLAGVPVIASNRGGLSEIVNEGVNGLLFDPEVAGSLEAALGAIGNDTNAWRERRSDIRQGASKYSDQSAWSAEWLRVYQSVLDKQP